MIKVLHYTPQPLTLMGTVASSCWNSKPSPKIGVECIESGHHRVLEFADVTVEISGYSARVVREIYTHVIGTSRLQASTRYINYGEFEYYVPDSIVKNDHAQIVYDDAMEQISKAYKKLEQLKIPKQDIANLLPLGMESTMVLKINARAILHMAELRLCARALKEFREFMTEFLDTVSSIDTEWEQIISYAQVICDKTGYCTERHSCGRKPKK